MQSTYTQTLRACYRGNVTQAVVISLGPLLFVLFQKEFSLSLSLISQLILLNFLTQLLMDFLSVGMVSRIGYRASAMLAHGLAVAGLWCLAVLPRLWAPYPGLCVSVVIYAAGGGLLEVLVSPIVDSLPSEDKASSMSLLHAFYCWGQVLVILVTTLALLALGNRRWPLLPLLWSLIPLYNLFIFRKVPLPPIEPEEKRMGVRQLLSHKTFLLLLVLMLCAGASEQAMSQWSSLFAEKGLGVSKVVGDLCGPCLFAALMGVGRTIYGVWGSRLPLGLSLAASGTLCVLCYGVTALSPWPALSLLACGMTGLSVGLMWPGVCSLASDRFPGGGPVMFSLLALCGDIGCSLGPWLAGMVSDGAQSSAFLLGIGARYDQAPEQLGLKVGLLCMLAFPTLLVFGVRKLHDVQKLHAGARADGKTRDEPPTETP